MPQFPSVHKPAQASNVVYQSRGNLVGPQNSPLNANAGLLNASSASLNLSAPTLNAPRLTASQVTATKNTDVLGPVIEHVGQQLGTAAILYSDRKSTVQAVEATNKFQKATRDMWLGSEQKDGSFKVGYASTSGKNGVEAHKPFQQALLQARNEIAADLGEAARSKFLASSNSTYQATLNSAAQHAAGSMQQYEKEQLGVQQATFYQTLDDLILAESPQQIDAMIADHLTNLSNNYSVSPDKIPAMQQQMFKDMGAFMASKPNAAAKLDRLTNQFGSQFDIETATYFNQQMQTVVAKENREMDRLIARADRSQRRQQQANDLALFANVTKGNEINWDQQLQLSEAGLLSSSVFISQQDRFQSKDYLPPMPPDAEINVKNQILEGTLTDSDILTLPYDDASVRRMGNFAISTKDHQTRNDLQYGYRRIDNTLREANMGLNATQRAQMTTQAQSDYEKLLKDSPGLTPQQAINTVLQSYVQDFQAAVSPMVVLPQGTTLDLTSMSQADATAAILAIESGISLDKAEKYFADIEAFYSSKNKTTGVTQ